MKYDIEANGIPFAEGVDESVKDYVLDVLSKYCPSLEVIVIEAEEMKTA